MRIAGLLLLGMVTGVIGAIMAINALSQGKDFPDGVMTLLDRHQRLIRQAVEASQCDVASLGDEVQTVRLVARDIEPAFLREGYDDPKFRDYAKSLRDKIDALQAALGQGCPTVSAAMDAVSQACKTCHQDY